MNQSNPTTTKFSVRDLYQARMDAIRKGDLKALMKLNDMIFFASLDPADPEYQEKLEWHTRNVRLRNAENKAKEVIEATGSPMTFDDKLIAINGAIDKALDAFEHIPCAKHAADLLGLIECWDLLFDANTTVMDEPAGGEADEHGD